MCCQKTNIVEGKNVKKQCIFAGKGMDSPARRKNKRQGTYAARHHKDAIRA
jgi:hypothetical protein